MSRSLRMFDIIQVLRGTTKPLTAQAMAERLEVTVRTVYRDIAALQALRVPIDGQAGVGYILRPGFDLPPLNLSAEEAEAVIVGLAMLGRTGDAGLQSAAQSAGEKIAAAFAHDGREVLAEWPLYASTWTTVSVPPEHVQALREAVRDDRKVRIDYTDAEGEISTRTILPVAVLFYIEVIVVAAWCELREDFRHFRIDRMTTCTPTDQTFKNRAKRLRADWRKTHQMP